MPLLANLVSLDAARDHAPIPATPVPRAVRTSRHRHPLPMRRSRIAWVISITVHLVLGLWIAAAVRTMLAESRVPEDSGITIRCLPAIPMPALTDDRLPVAQATPVIPEPESAAIAPPPIEAPAAPPPDPVYAEDLLEHRPTAPLTARGHVAVHRYRPPVHAGPAAGPGLPASVDTADRSGALPEAPVALPEPPAEAEPVVLDGPGPVYPAISLRDGHQGKVLLAMTIHGDGTVAEAHVQSSSGHRVLDAAALTAVRRWRFNAGSEGRHTTVQVVFMTM